MSDAASSRETLHGVWLGERRIGLIHQRGDFTRFVFSDEYRSDPERPILGLRFEDEELTKTHSAALRLPPWFSNLLPEGRIREWVAVDRGVSADREMELLAHMGHDLPGAVRIRPFDPSVDESYWEPPHAAGAKAADNSAEGHPGWRMSLAGVQLKFSVLSSHDRLTLPAGGEGGDWIVKLPDRLFADLPRNEYAMMSLAKASGIEVPELKLVHRDQIDGLPENVWPGREEWAYAIQRFDRGPNRELIHIEDLAQVRNVYPQQKYSGNFETIAALIYRGHDVTALREFTRRLAFIVLIGNGDAHLKNWSLIYRDPRRPTLAPAYDLVATWLYGSDREEDLGLKLGGSRDFNAVRLNSFDRVEKRLGATGAGLAEHAEQTIETALRAWPEIADLFPDGAQSLRGEMANRMKNQASLLTRR